MIEYRAMVILRYVLDKVETEELQRIFAWLSAYVAQRENKEGINREEGEETW